MSLLVLDEAAAPASPSVTTWPRRGASIAALLVDPVWDYRRWAEILGQYFAGQGLTRINVLTADWPTPSGLLWPFARHSDGRFDLYRFNPWFLERAIRIRDAMHAHGIVVQFTLLELYSWSNRKGFRRPGQRDLVVPDANFGPFRYNVNGVRWGGAYNGDRREDDATLATLPDAWIRAFLEWFLPPLDGPGVLWEIGNEFPEKTLHQRMAALIRQIAPQAQVSVNRQQDTPGQYHNMQIGYDYDRIAFHARLLKHPDDLQRHYPAEPTYRSFWEFFKYGRYDPARIIFSSDGGRISSDPFHTYDWRALGDFFEVVWRKGCSVEHQSRMKMPENRYTFSRVEHDFLARMAAM